MNTNSLKRYQEITDIFFAGLNAVKPDSAIHSTCRIENDRLHIGDRCYLLKDYQNIYVIGAGKGTAPMARAIEDILGDKLTDGLVVVKYGHTEPLSRIKIIEAAHPVPDEAGLMGAKEILAMAENATDNDLVVCLISGGGSALFPQPPDGIRLDDKQETTRILLACGATIHEINTIRKHLSLIKGGFLAKSVYPATLVTLIISDVIGDDLDIIASGPTVADQSSFGDCIDIIKKYKIINSLPPSVTKHLELGHIGAIPETPKQSHPCFAKAYQLVIASNRDAIAHVEKEALNRGYHTCVLSTMLQGESREIAKALVAVGKECAAFKRPVKTPACIITGGETTVTIKGNGKGGRNQEMALSAAIEMQGSREMMFLSCGTDGNDGPTDATGAVVDNNTISKAQEMKLDPLYYLENNDSYHFFQKAGGYVKTGPTNTNVMDVQILLVF